MASVGRHGGREVPKLVWVFVASGFAESVSLGVGVEFHYISGFFFQLSPDFSRRITPPFGGRKGFCMLADAFEPGWRSSKPILACSGRSLTESPMPLSLLTLSGERGKYGCLNQTFYRILNSFTPYLQPVG